MRIDNNNNMAFSAVRIKPGLKDAAARRFREIVASERHFFEDYEGVLFFDDFAAQKAFCLELRDKNIGCFSMEAGFLSDPPEVIVAIRDGLKKMWDFGYFRQ